MFGAAGGDQQLVGAQFTVPGGQHEFAVRMGDLAGLRVLQHLDAPRHGKRL